MSACLGSDKIASSYTPIVMCELRRARVYVRWHNDILV